MAAVAEASLARELLRPMQASFTQIPTRANAICIAWTAVMVLSVLSVSTTTRTTAPFRFVYRYTCFNFSVFGIILVSGFLLFLSNSRVNYSECFNFSGFCSLLASGFRLFLSNGGVSHSFSLVNHSGCLDSLIFCAFLASGFRLFLYNVRLFIIFSLSCNGIT